MTFDDSYETNLYTISRVKGLCADFFSSFSYFLFYFEKKIYFLLGSISSFQSLFTSL